MVLEEGDSDPEAQKVEDSLPCGDGEEDGLAEGDAETAAVRDSSADWEGEPLPLGLTV